MKLTYILLTLLVIGECWCAMPRGLTTDGIVDPPTHYQRFRRSEYSKSKPYYQWWYFTVKDLSNGQHFAFTYGYSESSNTTTTGGFLMFVHFDSAGGVSGSRYVKVPLNQFVVKGDFDVTIGSFGRLEPLDNDTVRITGRMSGANWYCSGVAVDCVGDITWDFTLERIYGWYGQAELEKGTHYDPLISWNTYAHDSAVRGSVTYVQQKKTWKADDSWRAYQDMNWGEDFPHPPSNTPDDLQYCWGWYDFVLPESMSSPEISFIMGSGMTETNFPFYSMYAQFADMRVGDLHTGARQASFWTSTWIKSEIVNGTNDGHIKIMNITRSDWGMFEDDHGKAKIPFTQSCTLETTNTRASITFRSKPVNYVRLLFAFKDTIFSDFEAVGVTCDYKFEARDNAGNWRQLKAGRNDNCGVEFGYYIDLKL